MNLVWNPSANCVIFRSPRAHEVSRAQHVPYISEPQEHCPYLRLGDVLLSSALRVERRSLRSDILHAWLLRGGTLDPYFTPKVRRYGRTLILRLVAAQSFAVSDPPWIV